MLLHRTAKNSFNGVTIKNDFECMRQILNSVVCVFVIFCESFSFGMKVYVLDKATLGENLVFVTREDTVN